MGGRAILALCLALGFYGLALGVIAVLLWIPYAGLEYGIRAPLDVHLVSWIGAATVAWATLPRVDRFQAPGPRLEPTDHPRFFEVLHELARSTGQRMPREVYIVAEVNAFVAERGGVMGLGSRRVMGLGLPLLPLLSVAELRAILAHELGHFHSGDVLLGAWIHRTRAGIVRTLDAASGSWLSKPYSAYARLFLRVSHAVSRRQEYAADRLAARSVGAAPLIEGVQRIGAGVEAYASYWRDEVLPLLNAGYRIPLTEGFRRYLGAEAVAHALQARLSNEEGAGPADPRDPHPCLRDRIEALRDAGIVLSEPPDEPPALELLDEPERVEAELLAHLSSEDEVRALKPVTWDQVGETVYIPLWQRQATELRAVTAGLTVGGLPEALSNAEALSARLPEKLGGQLSDAEREQIVNGILGAALAHCLVGQGFVPRVRPGEAIRLEHEGKSLDPFEAIGSLRSGALPALAWRAFCNPYGLAEISLQAEPLRSESAPADAPPGRRVRRRRTRRSL